MVQGSPRARDARTAVDKAACVLRAFGQDANLGVGVSELARRTRLNKSTTFRLLAMLERNGFVERAGTAYRIGHVIQELGALSITQPQDRIRDLMTPYLADLYEATHQTVQLAILAGADVVPLNKLEGHARLRTPSRPGGRLPAYSTAAGKVLLAHNPDAFERVLHAPRLAWTNRTIVREHELREEMRRVRHLGVAFEHGESAESLTSIAAPVMGTRSIPLAALSISGESSTFNPASVEHILRRVCLQASRSARALRLDAA